MEPSDIFALVRRACEFEVLAIKAGNVHPRASFVDTTDADFLKSAGLIEQAWAAQPDAKVGRWIYDAVKVIKQQIGKNTNLGIILLLAPLAKAALLFSQNHSSTIPSHQVLAGLTSEDASLVYSAIRLANPGGLGSASEHDVRDPAPSCLISAMQVAAPFDDIARQYVTNYSDVYALAQLLSVRMQEGMDILDALAKIQIEWLAERVDTLIGRKCGAEVAQNVMQHARQVRDSGSFGSDGYQDAWLKFDDYLRSDGNRLNPGTTADLLAAAIFIHLLQTTTQNDKS